MPDSWPGHYPWRPLTLKAEPVLGQVYVIANGPRQVYLWPPPRHHTLTLELNPKMLYAGWFGVGCLLRTGSALSGPVKEECRGPTARPNNVTTP